MVGSTLREIRRRVDALAAADGAYYVVCGRTGERPVPVAGKRFADRPTAESALRAATQYRATLRDYDPRLPHYDLIVCEATPGPTTPSPSETGPGADAGSAALSAAAPRRPLVDFCHEVASAPFETLAEQGCAAVERAIMELYLEAAETVDDRDEFCLLLVESMAAELSERLTPDEQARVLRAAAGRLSPVAATAAPVPVALRRLASVSLVTGYGLARSGDEWLVTVRGYALDGTDRRLPTLPIALELYRHHTGPLSIPGVRSVGAADWEFTLALDADRDGVGLVRTAVTP